MDIREFLEARLAEDEARAREACDSDSGRWFMGDKWNVYRAEDEAPEEDFEENKLVTWGNVKPQSEHIARHDPARVLRDVEAARQRIELAAKLLAERGHKFWAYAGGQLLRLEAARYADHPDYDPTWSPEASHG